MLSRRRPGSQRRHRFAVAVAGLLVLGQLALLFHSGAVLHQRCAEHGELLHLGAGEPTPADRAAPPTGTRFDAGRPSATDDGHQHCLASAHRRAGAADPARQAGSLAPPARLARLPVGPPAAPSLLRRLRLAPKTSPPA